MGRVWVLDTETKGTGAEMVPLDKVLRKPAASPEPLFVPPEPAPRVELLVAFRVLQAVGASMMNLVAMSIITNVFTVPRERAQAVGVWGAMFGISLALGPIVGGALVSSVGWRAIFLINLPIGLAAILLTLRFVPES